MVQVLESLQAELRERAVALEGFSPDASRAFMQAAERTGAALEHYLDEPLSIREAADEHGWNYEALRQRLHRDGLLESLDGRNAVRRRVMLEQVGRGRGQRRTAERRRAKARGQAPEVELDTALRAALSRARKRTNHSQ